MGLQNSSLTPWRIWRGVLELGEIGAARLAEARIEDW